MNLKKNKNTLLRNLRNIPGWRTKRKIVVFDSDDWGSIRMPSRAVYERLLKRGLNLNGGDGLRYSLYDTIASKSDLEFLFETLGSFRDINNSFAVFTANSIVANPDFDKIKEDNFQKYYYEPVTETIKRYYGDYNIFSLWKEGINSQVFVPQLHGREHLNVTVWMNALRNNDKETLEAFNEGVWAFMPKYYSGTDVEYEAAFQLTEYSEIDSLKTIIEEGVSLFEKLFGYVPKYFVPPNGRIINKLNFTCFKHGIKYRSNSILQREVVEGGKIKKSIHWLGQKDKSGICYIIRNSVFEPGKPGIDWVDRCLNDIKVAFKYGKPAVISTHRVNYIGVHDVKNRDNGLKELHRLLSSILKAWPDVEFMSSDQLGDLIAGEGSNE